jgi:flagellar motor switch protein FliN
VSHDAQDLDRIADIPIDIRVELGRRVMTVGDLLDVTPGQVIALDRLADGLTDLYVADVFAARGEVVIIDEEFGIRVTELGTELPDRGESDEAEVPAWGSSDRQQ